MTNGLNDLNTARDAFIANLKNTGKATSTILAYTNDIDQFVTFLKQQNKNDLKSVSGSEISEYKNFLKIKAYTNKSISRKLNSIRTFFRFLLEQKIVEKNPTDDIEHPKIKVKPPRILTKMEYRALRDVCSSDHRIYAIIEMFLQTGIRISELSNLRLEDVKNDKLIIQTYESHPAREVTLNKAAKEALETYFKERPKTKTRNIFVTKTGKPFLIRNIRSAVERQFKLADIDNATVNDLRHTFIAHQLKAGTPLIVVSKIVGHKRLSTTEKYLKYISIESEKGSMHLEEL